MGFNGKCVAFYRCGPPTGVQEDYDRVCTKLGNLSDPLLYNTSNVLGDIQDYYDRNLIDNPINIRNKRLYVFAGTRNELFTTGTVFIFWCIEFMRSTVGSFVAFLCRYESSDYERV